MAKSTSSTTTTTTIDEVLLKDRELLLKLRRVTRPTFTEMEEIFYLYKKYIDANAQSYCMTCQTSVNSITRYYWKVTGLNI